MDNLPSDPIPPELRVSMDTEFKMTGLASNAELPKLQDALSTQAGVESVIFIERSVRIRYDPERVTNAELLAIVARTGVQVDEAGSSPAAPPIEAHEDGGGGPC